MSAPALRPKVDGGGMELDRNDTPNGRGSIRRVRKVQGRITDRDRQLIGLLAIARYLSTEQVSRLFFPGRHPETSRKRLLMLAGEGTGGIARPYLRRLQYRSFDGRPSAVWTPNSSGYWLAEQILGTGIKVPRTDVSAEFLEHSILLNELLVKVLAAPLEKQLKEAEAQTLSATTPERDLNRLKERIYASATLRGFNWRASDSVRLPWTQYDLREGTNRDRVIVPDAVVELPQQRRRLFIECETGSHTIEPKSGSKPGSTISKLERYDDFMGGIADLNQRQTFYAFAFPDLWTPEVLFLVQSPGRAASVNEAIARWKNGRAGVRVRGRATTVELAANELAASTTSSRRNSGPESKLEFSDADAALLKQFYNEAIMALKEVRAAARARNVHPPAYPESAQRMLELVQRLESTRHS